MRVVLVAFIIAASCPIANETAFAKSKHSYRPSSQHDSRHHEAKLHDDKLHRELKDGRARGGISLSVAAIQAGELVITGQAPSPRTVVSADERFATGSSQNGRFMAASRFTWPTTR